MMKDFKIGEIGRDEILHGGIGGGICFLVMFLLIDIAQTGFQQLIFNFGFLGITVFSTQYEIARSVFAFGTVYLVGGFCGGLYTGYNIYEKLKITLLFPPIIGVTAFLVLIIVLGSVDILFVNIIGNVLSPYLGTVVGSFLGGYAMNWNIQEPSSVEESFS